MKERERKDAGKDEMNFAEFPIALLSERAPRGVTTLERELVDWDSTLKRRVTRKLTVEGSKKHGLPTPKDDEVLMGLIQLSKKFNDFTSPVVHFTQRSLLQEIKWNDEGKSYARLRKAFNRLMGVTLYYENAWKDNSDKQYVTTGGFGVLSRFEIRDARRGEKKQSDTEPDSLFEWTSVVQKSFQAGHLKDIDYAMLTSFHYAATRRLYRYLDKHFYPEVGKTTLCLDLKTLAYQHIGVSVRKDSSAIKDAIGAAIKELEDVGYIHEKSKHERFQKSGRNWQVLFHLRQGCSKQALSKRKRTPRTSDASTASEASTSPFLDQLMLEGKEQCRRVIEEALTFCDMHHPEKSDGYRRSKKRKGRTAKVYLELVLEAYLTSSEATAA